MPYFNQQTNKAYKVLIAAYAPLVAFIPIGISKYLAIRQSFHIIEPGRSFVLVYMLRVAFIALCRIMQADFKNRWIYIGLSFLHSVTNVFGKVTERLQEKLWRRLISFLKATCCPRLEHAQYDSQHHRRASPLTWRYKIYSSIHNTGVESRLILYQITNVDVSAWPMLKESLVRVSIAMIISFVSSCVAVFVQIHWHDIYLCRVWRKYWKRHLLANGIFLAVLVTNSTRVLLSVHSQVEMTNSGMKNCISYNKFILMSIFSCSSLKWPY